MSRSRLLIAYDGSATDGWQAQTHGNTIQQYLEAALACLLRKPVRISGASRTDRGVHAMGQVAHFDHECDIDPYRFLYGLNGLLPSTIRVLSHDSSFPNFHSQYHAKCKTYWYDFHLAPYHLPWTYTRRLHVSPLQQMKYLQDACSLFVGTHNFRAFRNSNPCSKKKKAENTVRTIFQMEFQEIPAGVRLVITGDGFLYKMIRNLVGSLLALDKGKVTIAILKDMLHTGNRTVQLFTAPAKGLCLHSIFYDSNFSWKGIEAYQMESWI